MPQAPAVPGSSGRAGPGSAEPPRHPALSEGRAGTYLSHSEAVVKSVISNTSDSGYGERGEEVVSGESRGRERDSRGTGKEREQRDKHSLRCPPPSCAAAGPPQRRRLPGTWWRAVPPQSLDLPHSPSLLGSLTARLLHTARLPVMVRLGEAAAQPSSRLPGLPAPHLSFPAG